MRLVGLFIYPVKSCRGIAVERARVVERGLEHDRRWMIVDSVGRFLTQRELPALQLIATALDGNSVTLTPGTMTAEANPHELVVHALDEESLQDLYSGRLEQKVGNVFKASGSSI